MLEKVTGCMHAYEVVSAVSQSENLAKELVQKLPAAALASLIASLSVADVAAAADLYTPPTATQTVENVQTKEFAAPSSAPELYTAPSPASDSGLPEGNQWRYSEFISAVQSGKVERVRFSKDGSQLQLTAVDGRRALVVLPNDPDLVSA